MNTNDSRRGEAPRVCSREGCDTPPMRGERFCSVLHRRQHELLYGWDAPQECTVDGCEAPQAEGNPGCSCDDGLCRDCATDYRAAIDAVRELHQPIREGAQGYDDRGRYGYIEPACSTCGTADDQAVEWPCPTILALDGGVR